ncbi:glycosyl transferase [Nadsonia fulvescens var. elongata DSM 6958]|uniref:Glycosyl transferase n=1 Tax=Nadsonia fulvescens var. elongata DSM 6958 TaxID=857566 RepID=A0A1E3PGY9_9ASCO|nr:glycosyl transferase [Nadsonia fulvescens var. elongata DSM 6958]
MANRQVRVIRFIFIVVILFYGTIKLLSITSRSDLVLSMAHHGRPDDAVVAQIASEKQAKINAAKLKVSLEKALRRPSVGKDYVKANATLVTLARNNDLWGIVQSIKDVETRFNRVYKYDWVFLNDEEFNSEFMDVTRSMISGNVKFGKIPKEHWGFPDWIDQEKSSDERIRLEEENVIYGGSLSYRHMCRFESGFFFDHPLLQEYRYYWRIEPDIRLYCDINYDIIKYMEDNNKTYGWTLSLIEFEKTIPTLWNTTKDFIASHPQYLAQDNLLDFISKDDGQTYNLCHFWSNFEIADMDFWRSEIYREYFNHLDRAGGFFYERWGDAPVHSIAASLFLPKNKIHHFEDIGYYHMPFGNCPTDKATQDANNCACESDNFSWTKNSCTPRFYNVIGESRQQDGNNLR